MCAQGFSSPSCASFAGDSLTHTLSPRNALLCYGPTTLTRTRCNSAHMDASTSSLGLMYMCLSRLVAIPLSRRCCDLPSVSNFHFERRPHLQGTRHGRTHGSRPSRYCRKWTYTTGPTLGGRPKWITPGTFIEGVLYRVGSKSLVPVAQRINSHRRCSDASARSQPAGKNPGHLGARGEGPGLLLQASCRAAANVVFDPPSRRRSGARVFRASPDASVSQPRRHSSSVPPVSRFSIFHRRSAHSPSRVGAFAHCGPLDEQGGLISALDLTFCSFDATTWLSLLDACSRDPLRATQGSAVASAR